MSGEDRYGSRSPDRGGEYRSPGASPYRSRSVSRSRSRSRSPRSYSRSPPPKGKAYSRSPSHSPPPKRGRKRSYSRSSSRSRSRSHSRSRRHKRYSRSRSRSYSPYARRRGGGGRYNRGRNRSRSPMSARRRHQGNRFNPRQGRNREFNPSPCRVVGVFGLSLYTGEKEIRDMFSKYGPIEQVQVVYDHQTGRSRGFSFIYYEDTEDAIDAKEHCNGLELDGRKIRVDYSITKRAHTPTPGVYMGKPTRSSHEERGERGDRGDRGGGGRYDDHDDYHDKGRSSHGSRY